MSKLEKSPVWVEKNEYVRGGNIVRKHGQFYHVNSKNQARLFYYRTQPLDTRLRDESKAHSRKEILKIIKSSKFSPNDRKFIAKWALEPQKYDISGIDDPMPKGFKLFESDPEPTSTYNIGPLEYKNYELGIVDKEGELAARAEVQVNEELNTAEIVWIKTEKKYQQIGMSPYMLRATFNWIDQRGYKSELTALPVLPEIIRMRKAGIITLEEQEQYLEAFAKAIKNVYRSYGMEFSDETKIAMERPAYNGLREI